MKKLILSVAITLALASSVIAQGTPEVTAGQVTKVDQSAQKITIKHGPIKKYDMEEGMTMVFRTKDPAMLKQVKPGDKIKFESERINGQFTVTRIEKAR